MLTKDGLLRLLDELIEQQKEKVLKIARQSIPGATPEDIRNPQDLPALTQNAHFHFEDGILSGYLSAKMAILAEWTQDN